MNTNKSLFVCILANTETSLINGISAAGKDAKSTFYTPTGDCELIDTGNIVTSPTLPMTPPFDTPTPALITRSILELVNIPYMFIDTGLVYPPDINIQRLKISNICG